MKLAIISVLSYLLGCIPSAYIFFKIACGRNILNAGTGNVGALNSYESSGKKWVGLATLLADLFKGMAAAYISIHFAPGDFTALSLASVFVLFGHNFNVFLKGRGGRGLATAAGISLIINPLILILWVLMFFTGFYIIKKKVHVGAINGIIATPILMYSAPGQLIDLLTLAPGFTYMQIRLLSLFICLVLALRHIQPFFELMKERKNA